MNMVGPLKTLSWRPPHWIYQHHYSRLQWNIRSCKPNLEAIQDDLGPGRKAAKLRDQHIKSTGHCENTKGNIWKNTNGKEKVRLNKIYRIHPAQILKSFKVGNCNGTELCFDGFDAIESKTCRQECLHRSPIANLEHFQSYVDLQH